MVRRTRSHIPGDSSTPTTDLTPSHLTKEQFGRRVRNLMYAKGWRQSELARKADLPRDSISVYVRGLSLPTPASLRKLAEALDVTPEELLPNQIEGAIHADFGATEMKISQHDLKKAWLRVNRLVSTDTATKIIALLNDDDAFASGN